MVVAAGSLLKLLPTATTFVNNQTQAIVPPEAIALLSTASSTEFFFPR